MAIDGVAYPENGATPNAHHQLRQHEIRPIARANSSVPQPEDIAEGLHRAPGEPSRFCSRRRLGSSTPKIERQRRNTLSQSTITGSRGLLVKSAHADRRKVGYRGNTANDFAPSPRTGTTTPANMVAGRAQRPRPKGGASLWASRRPRRSCHSPSLRSRRSARQQPNPKTSLKSGTRIQGAPSGPAITVKLQLGTPLAYRKNSQAAHWSGT